MTGISDSASSKRNHPTLDGDCPFCASLSQALDTEWELHEELHVAARDLLDAMKRPGNALDLIRDHATDAEHAAFGAAWDRVAALISDQPEASETTRTEAHP